MFNLINGDCLDIMKDINSNSIDLIVSDPPYGVEFKQDFYDDSLGYVLGNIDNWFAEWYRLLKNDSYLFLFVGVKTLHIWIQKGIEAGFTYKNIISTRSYNSGSVNPKNNFGFQFQPIIVFSKGNGKPFNNVDFIPTSNEWFNDKRNKNPQPYTYQYPNFIPTELAYATVKSSKKNLHPNQKNTALIKFFIQLTTEKNDIVLDCFNGSGSTGDATIECGRKYIGIEQDKEYYNISLERLNTVSYKLCV